MYRTSQGERILQGAERRLFEESLGMMVDDLSVDDVEFGVPAFDQLQMGQKLFALYRAGRALLQPDEPPPEITAFLDAAVAAVYQHAFDMVLQEIDDPDFVPREPSCRQLVIEAARESDIIDQAPMETNCDKEEWEMMVECLTDQVLRDRDFDLDVHLDADPDATRSLKQMVGISETYYTAVAHDPPDEQLNLYIDALKGLTPRGRGESAGNDGTSDEPENEFF